MIIAFVKGIIIGLAVSAPVGPMAIICINRSLRQGRIAGLATGMGIALADGIYSFIAAFSVAVVMNFLMDFQNWIRFLGGIFLLYLAYRTGKSHPKKKWFARDEETKLVKEFYSALLLTLTNPATIIAFIAIFAGLGLGSVHGNYLEASSLVIGVFAGSLLWWVFLSTIAIAIFKDRFNDKTLMWINRISAAIIFAFGVGAIVTALEPLVLHLVSVIFPPSI